MMEISEQFFSLTNFCRQVGTGGIPDKILDPPCYGVDIEPWPLRYTIHANINKPGVRGDFVKN